MLNVKKLVTGVIAALGVGAVGAAANGTTANADSVYTVQSGDTLSSIAQKELGDSSRYQEIANANGIQDVNNISVGQTLKISDGDQSYEVVLPETSVQPVQEQATQPVQEQEQEQPVENIQEQNTQQATQSNSTDLSGNSAAARRRQIESGGNYNTNTGNGYVGAYQFAPSTIASIESQTGMKWSMDPSTQDAFADYYANSRYGGWQNVPTNGGW